MNMPPRHEHPRIGPKPHPASRELGPDDPLALHGVQLPGDPRLMLRLLAQEYAQLGWSVEQILQLARNPAYRAFHGLRRQLGPERFEQVVRSALARCGVLRVTAREAQPAPERLVQITLPETRHGA